MLTIAVISGKGGTGKTTITASLGYILASEYKKKVCLIDADVGLSCLTRLFKVSYTLTLRDALKDPAIKLAHIMRPALSLQNLLIVPSGTALHDLVASNPKILVSKLLEVSQSGVDVTLIDAPAGISSVVIASMVASDKYMLVEELNPWGIDAALKLKSLAEKLQKPSIGLVLNDVVGWKGTVRRAIRSIEEIVGIRVLGVVPNDKVVRKATMRLEVLAEKYPKSKATKAIREVAKKVAELVS
ncbi:MAG: hypothetical protein DRN99_04045 [Thermoproteota archaeon]|nr:MAG: hypothetical protein DRN99_04045 [Candidatus Korarchaeota archaeon]